MNSNGERFKNPEFSHQVANNLHCFVYSQRNIDNDQVNSSFLVNMLLIIYQLVHSLPNYIYNVNQIRLNN